MTRQQSLTEFLTAATSLCEGKTVWGTMPLQLTYYLSKREPPLEYVSSVRAIVFREDSALVITQENGEVYILPGGRVEKGEKALETLKREILEETGWALFKTKLLGGMHFHHLGLKPEGYAYPYPVFLWPIYIAEAKDFTAEAIIHDDWVSESHFLPIDEVRKLTIRQGELLLLETALELR